MTSFLKSATKIRLEFDSSLFFLRSRQNVGHPNIHHTIHTESGSGFFQNLKPDSVSDPKNVAGLQIRSVPISGTECSLYLVTVVKQHQILERPHYISETVKLFVFQITSSFMLS